MAFVPGNFCTNFLRVPEVPDMIKLELNFVAGQKENNTNTQQTHTKPHVYSSFSTAVAAMSGADGGRLVDWSYFYTENWKKKNDNNEKKRLFKPN